MILQNKESPKLRQPSKEPSKGKDEKGLHVLMKYAYCQWSQQRVRCQKGGEWKLEAGLHRNDGLWRQAEIIWDEATPNFP